MQQRYKRNHTVDEEARQSDHCVRGFTAVLLLIIEAQNNDVLIFPFRRNYIKLMCMNTEMLSSKRQKVAAHVHNKQFEHT